jgi:hypothetical protein
MNKYILVKSYYGLGGDLSVLLGAMILSNQTGREVLVDWDGGLYGNSPNMNISLFNCLFKSPVFSTSKVLSRNCSVYPKFWKDYINHAPLTYINGIDLTKCRPEDAPQDCQQDCIIVTRDSKWLRNRTEIYHSEIKKLKLADDINQVVDDFLAINFDYNKIIIGIHFRHGNGEYKVIPPDPKWFRNNINQILTLNKKNQNDLILFVCSDCSAVLNYFKKYYPCVLSTDKKYLSNGLGAFHVEKGTHHIPRIDLENCEKIRLAKEALVDMYILAKAHFFLGSGGFFSQYVSLLRHGENQKIYSKSRIYSNFQFNENYFPAANEPVISDYLREYGFPLDGLFIHIEQNRKKVFYYNAFVGDYGIKINSDEGLKIRQSIIDLRLY